MSSTAPSLASSNPIVPKFLTFTTTITNVGPPSRISFRPLRVSASCTSTVTKPQTAPPSSLYEVLGIYTGATYQEIKAAYRRLARTLHPDVIIGSSSSSSSATTNGQRKENVTSEFIRVNEAYETLSDPNRRADYDRSLFWRRTGASLVSGYAKRRWETDQCW